MDIKLKKTKKFFHLMDNERMLMKKYYHKRKKKRLQNYIKKKRFKSEKKQNRKLIKNPLLLQKVLDYLKQQYSAEVISKALLQSNEKISHQAIYTYIYYDKQL